MDDFCHIHVHSHYSLLDGANRIGDLVDTAGEMGMKSLALTDHGNLFGAIEFYKAARKGGIKPILGMEAYISPTTMDDRTMGSIKTAAYHLLLLAMNETGWRNLVKLSSRAYMEGFYYRPRIDKRVLAELNEGLICTTACLGGEVPSALLTGQKDLAKDIASQYLRIFGPDRFFIEVQNQGVEDQDKVNPLLAELAEELGVGLVGTNDVHFLRRQDKAAHEVLTCISTGKTLADENRMSYPEEVYFKSSQEMRQALIDWPGAADNTLKIAEMCNVELDFTAKHLPRFEVPTGQTDREYLAEMARKGLEDRFKAKGIPIPDEYVQRLNRELEVIEGKGYTSYFLIINDCVQYARSNGIPAAPRGSAVATLLGYTLGICEIDPIEYGLLFERFTDPQRDEDPDYDIDICQDGRSKVIQYVREKYGHVAQIITYGTLKAKAVLRDVGRVMGMPLGDVDTITKLVPDALKMTLEKALLAEPELKKMYDSDPQVKQLIDTGKRLEGLARHVGVHAAGVIVAQEPLENLVPLSKQADSTDAMTQWDGPTCDFDAGLMKMDLLGLRTLSIVRRARELVRESTGKDVDPEKVDLTDDKVFELFRNGQTDGVFQFESDGMKSVLMQMQPSEIGDLIAANAMYRPGPMELIPTYCDRKSGQHAVPSVHAIVDDELKETYGIMCYQEQVMQVLHRLGKLSLNRALTLIKAISKKKHKTIESERPNFMIGAQEHGISEDQARDIFELILKFAGYGFNKAHSTRYAIVAYQTAYFKVYYPREFLAATLTFESGDTDKVVQYMSEAARMGITIAPPDINACGSDFAVDGDSVRFGLSAVKGVGVKAVDAIVAARNEVGEFSDLYDFCKHVDLRAANRSTVEALIKCGAFDAHGAHRAAMTAALDHAIELGQQAAADRRSGQMNFFNILGDETEPKAARFPNVEPWSEAQLLAAEKETLGFYITSHPLVKHGRELDSLSAPAGFALARADDYSASTDVTIGCMIASVRPTVTRSKGEKMAMLTVEDLTGKCDAVLFPRTYEQYSHLVKVEEMVFLRGSIDKRRERPNIIVDEIIPIAQAIEELAGAVLVRIKTVGRPGEELLQSLKAVLEHNQGNRPVFIEMRPSERTDVLATLRLGAGCSVKPSQQLVDELAELVGAESVVLRPSRPKPRPKRNNGYKRLAPKASSGTVSPAVTRFN